MIWICLTSLSFEKLNKKIIHTVAINPHFFLYMNMNMNINNTFTILLFIAFAMKGVNKTKNINKTPILVKKITEPTNVPLVFIRKNYSDLMIFDAHIRTGWFLNETPIIQEIKDQHTTILQTPVPRGHFHRNSQSSRTCTSDPNKMNKVTFSRGSASAEQITNMMYDSIRKSLGKLVIGKSYSFKEAIYSIKNLETSMSILKTCNVIDWESCLYEKISLWFHLGICRLDVMRNYLFLDAVKRYVDLLSKVKFQLGLVQEFESKLDIALQYYSSSVRVYSSAFKSSFTSALLSFRDSGFVSFSTLVSKSQAEEIIHHPKPFKFHVEPAPLPEDIFWKNVGIPHKQCMIGLAISVGLTTALCIFWTIPITFLTCLTEVDNLKNRLTILKDALENNPSLEDLFFDCASNLDSASFDIDDYDDSEHDICVVSTLNSNYQNNLNDVIQFETNYSHPNNDAHNWDITQLPFATQSIMKFCCISPPNTTGNIVTNNNDGKNCTELTGTVTNDGVTSKEVVKTKTRAGRRVTRPRRLIEEIN